MAAGTSSRFAPLSYETHKSLLTVRGEVLIERQIRQLQEAGVVGPEEGTKPRKVLMSMEQFENYIENN